MTFKPAIWHPIAVVLSIVNWAGLGAAVEAGEPWHAALHGVLALAFGYWALRLRQSRGAIEPQAQFDLLEAEMSNLRRELSETQERLDFAERVLAQAPESRRVDPER